MKKFLEGCEKLADGRYRIRETISVGGNKVEKIPLKESKVIVEGKEYSVGNSYRFKIWDSDPTEKGFNANGRNYCHLVERAKNMKDLVTLSLADHPEDGNESVTRYCGVEKNIRLDDDGWLSYEFIPIGEYGRNICEIIDNGGYIEMSSSILGDLDDNGYVIAESATIERLGDWVVNCSNRLLQYSDKTEVHTDEGNNEFLCDEGCKSNLTISNEDEIEESVVNKHRNNATESKNIKEKKEMPENELLETTLGMNIKSIIKDADKTENLYEKKDLLESAHCYAEKLTDKTLLNETSEKIAKVNEEIKVLTEKGLKADELAKNVETLEEEKKTISEGSVKLEEEKKVLQEKYDTLVKMYEEKQFKASEVELERNHNLSKEVCSLKLKARRQENSMKVLEKENKLLKEKIATLKATSNTMVNAEIVKDLQEQIEELTNKNVRLSESVKAFRKAKLEESRVSRPSRFEQIRNRLPNRNIEKVVESKEVESNGLSEDEKMEKMLNGAL